MIIRILFVDAETAYLRNLKDAVHSTQTAWDTMFASSGADALELLEKHQFDIIITNIRLPDVDGIKFLTIIMNKYPQIVRFVLFDPIDEEEVKRISNIAHQCLPKASNLAMLKDAVQRAFSLQNILAGDKIKKIISQVDKLPGLPDIYLQITKEMRSNDPSVKRVGQLVERDPGLSAQVLKMANSAFFGLRQHVSSPSHAASMLGLNAMQSLVLFVDIFEQFDRIKMMVPDFSLEEFQRHSMAVSTYASAIAQKRELGRNTIDEAMMVGLLHDTGKLILAQNFPQQYNKVLEFAREKRISAWMAEWTVFGATHAEIGAYLLGLWGFSNSLVEMCAFHHQPRFSRQADSPNTATLHIADAFAHEDDLAKLQEVEGLIDLKYVRSLGLEEQLPIWRALCTPIESSPYRMSSVPKPPQTLVTGQTPAPITPKRIAPPPSKPQPKSFWQRIMDIFKW